MNEILEQIWIRLGQAEQHSDSFLSECWPKLSTKWTKWSFFIASGLYSQSVSCTSQNSKDKNSMHLWSWVPLKRQNHFSGKWIERTFYQVASVWTGDLYTTSITGQKQPSTPLAEFCFFRYSSFISVQAEALLGEFRLLFCSFTKDLSLLRRNSHLTWV